MLEKLRGTPAADITGYFGPNWQKKYDEQKDIKETKKRKEKDMATWQYAAREMKIMPHMQGSSA
ncbi:hypothetical protein VCV18_008833 [Metarhizium anisopliae]